MARRQGEQKIPKGREGYGHPHGAYNINGRWLGGDDRVTLAVERSMSHCHRARCTCMCVYMRREYIYIYILPRWRCVTPQRRGTFGCKINDT